MHPFFFFFEYRQTNELGYGGIEANRDSFEPSLSGVNKFLSENGICSQGNKTNLYTHSFYSLEPV